MDVAELRHHFYVPAFSIEVEGPRGKKELLDEGVEIFSVTVNNTLKGADDFSFTINNPKDVDTSKFLSTEFRHLKDQLFKVGSKVTIRMGYGDRSRLKSVISGIITAIDFTFPANGISQMTIKGYDRSHKMMKGRHSDSWGSDKNPVTYSDVVKQIAEKKQYQFGTSHIEETQEKHRQVKQDRQSDFDFIQKKLAEEISFEVFIRDNDLYFRPRQNDSPDFVAELTWGQTLISFSPKINTAKQVSEVNVRGWNPATQKPIIGKAKRGSERGRDQKGRSGGEAVAATQGEVVKNIWRPVSTQKEADDIAKSTLEKISLDYITGSGESLGLPNIVPGKNIKLKGLGMTFSKIYYVEKVSHSISTSGYKTTFDITENTVNERTI